MRGKCYAPFNYSRTHPSGSQQRQQRASEIRRQNEAKFDSQGVRDV